MRKLLLMGMLVCSLFLSGCAFIDEFFLPTPEDTVQEVFEAGNEALRDKNYKQAATYFTRIKEEHPFSPYAIRSELALADVPKGDVLATVYAVYARAGKGNPPAPPHSETGGDPT